MADTDPLNYPQRRHPDLDTITHGLTLWDLDREFPVGGFNGQQFMKLRDVGAFLLQLFDAACDVGHRCGVRHSLGEVGSIGPGIGVS